MGGAAVTNRMKALEGWAAGLLAQLEPASRKKLARSLGLTLRRSQQRRIIAQRNPDGSKYAPRKQRKLRGKLGRLKRKVHMFQRLRTVRFLRIRGDGNTISIGFRGRVARIARVHQYGLKDRAERDAPAVRYKNREILGFSSADFDQTREGLLLHLTQ
jgi:phage virion morphogenesis protein